MKTIFLKFFHFTTILILINLALATTSVKDTLAAPQSPSTQAESGKESPAGNTSNSPSALATVHPENISFQEVATGIDDPVFIANADDGSGRLFFVEQTGYIRILKNDVVLGTPFLDIHSIIKFGGEQGLLALAFH